MAEYSRAKTTRCSTHPGAILREDVLPKLGLSVSAFAAAVHTSRQTAHNILAEERGITPEMVLEDRQVLRQQRWSLAADAAGV